MSTRLAEPLHELIDAVQLGPDATTATVLGTELDAPDPAGMVAVLASRLYRDGHAGMADDDRPRPRTLREPRFEAALAAAMTHPDSPKQCRLIRDDGPSALVELDGLRVRIPTETVTAERPLPVGSTVTIRIPAARPALSPGFLLADSSRGWAREYHPNDPLLRMYLHVADPARAASAWGAVVGQLESMSLGYRAKVLSSAGQYPRRDAIVVYLASDSWFSIPQLLAGLDGADWLAPQTSRFVHRAAPGIGLAWEPRDLRPGKRALSFGEHRSLVLAEALVSQPLTHDQGDRELAVLEALLNADIDPMAPARCLDSPPLPGIGLG